MDEKGIVIGRDVPDLFQPSALGKNRRFIETDENQVDYPLPVETSVVTRWRRMFSSTTTQFNLMSGLSASNLVESFWSSIIAGLLTVAMSQFFAGPEHWLQ